MAYLNLFHETGKQRKKRTNGFYSSRHYASIVRHIDLSGLDMRQPVSDEQIDRLTADCINLESLDLYNCHYLTNATLTKILKRSPALKHLYLTGVSEVDVTSFQQREARNTVRRLQSLDIYLISNFFHCVTPRKIGLLHELFGSLRFLKLGDGLYLKDSVAYADIVSCFPSLEHLWLSNSAKPLIHAFLDGCTRLCGLKLAHCKLDRETTKKLPSQLVSIEIEDCSVQAEGVHELLEYDYRHTTTLGLKRTRNITDSNMQCILRRANPRLQRLYLPSSTTDDILNTVMTYFSSITALSITSGKISSEALRALLKTYQGTLTDLELNVAIMDPNDNAISSILQQWPNPHLRTLALTEYKMEAEIFRNLPQLYPCLHTLRACFPAGMTGSEIHSVTKNMKYLVTLKLDLDDRP
ncbi:hypothetical protein DFQ28_007271 [Apophysomyces sp. BC1034]|nr:hypothetical protein DFQ29_005364 [Apophysomyces sp. BC1021]KAG0186824.1 hypothetical protein DFQ28_007271 [Apophysomyces sp. BC1034]